MKNKFALISIIGLALASLTACNLFDFLPNLDINGDGIHFSRQTTDISTPPPGDSVPHAASVTYDDLVERSVYPMSNTPNLGTAKILVIPVWFNDSDSFIKTANRETVRSDIQKAYFGSNEDTGWRSVKTFYEEESFGAFTLEGTVSEWYEPGVGYSYYGVDKTSSEEDSRTSKLVKSATTWYFNNHSSDSRKNYDVDGDGYLDGVMLIYAAPDYSASKKDSYTNLWAYCYWIQDPDVKNVTNPGANAYFWASYDFMYGKETISHTGYSYSSINKVPVGGDTSNCTLDTHTFIHEMGHMFALEDYYDYSNYSYQPAGGFSMQDHNVGGHDPYSSFALGWGKAYVPIETTNIDLKPFALSGEMIILSPEWNAYNSPFDEYLILEYYTNEGLNAFDNNHKYMSQYGKNYPTGSEISGIRLWHVDSRLVYTNSGSFSASKITTNPLINGQRVALMMSNTYDDNKSDGYISILGSAYADYNLLQLIRSGTSYSHKTKEYFVANHLFYTGDTFTMEKYGSQFVNKGKLNSKKDLGFSFTVNACNSTYASITITKL